MRTTLALDDDVAAKLKQVAYGKKISFKEAVNSTLRRGLAAQEVVQKSRPFRVATFRSAFRPGVDPLRLNQLVDELEIQDAVSDRRR
jgi:hypothetical protein